MNSPIKLNPHDFEYLTKSDQEYLEYIQRLYLYNSGQLHHFRTLGPWHQVTSSELNDIVYRVAAPVVRPCSKGHVKGLWCIEDPDYVKGPKILKYQGSVVESSPDQSTSQSSSSEAPTTVHKVRPPSVPKNRYSIPRKYQVIPRPSPWIIMEPSKKKNFICDDPPDPTYDRQVRSAGTQRTKPTEKPIRPATSGGDRYVASPYSTGVTPGELNEIVQRVRKPTHASKGGKDLQEKFRNNDYVYGSKKCKPNIEHITKPTVSSRGGVDIAEKFESKDYVYGSKTVPAEKLDTIVERVTRPTTASTGGAGKERSHTDFVYGQQKVSKAQLKEIIDRIAKPTVSSEGGVALHEKKYEYIKPAKVKTNIIIPGLDRRFIGRKKLSQDDMSESVERMVILTPAYKAKFAINPHVWKDDSARTGPAHVRQSGIVAT